jgi:hypothetical protein
MKTAISRMLGNWYLFIEAAGFWQAASKILAGECSYI